MMVAITALWDYSNLLDMDLNGFTQIVEFNNSINIFQSEHSIPTNKTHFPEVPT